MLLATSNFFAVPAAAQKCSYGPRGSLTSTCENAIPKTFKTTSYKFDHLDETVVCIKCDLSVIEENTFDISGNVILTLNLTSSNINVLKNQSFVGLVFMRNLILQDNLIKSIPTGVFTGIKELRTLNLEGNKIESLEKDGFIQLLKLEVLRLTRNEIKAINNDSFRGLNSLLEVDLSFNKISSIKNIFNNLKTIKKIDISQNNINSIEMRDINTTSLLELNLAYNQLTTINPDTFFFLRNLTTLDLSSNQIKTIYPRSFKGLSKLETLNLKDNAIDNIDRNVFIGLYSLRSINLACNKLLTTETSTFTSLPSLNILDISSNNLENFQITGLFDLPRLHTLDLSNNSLSDLDYLALIRRMPVLTSLNLRGNKFYCHWILEVTNFFKEENLDLFVDKDFSVLNCTIQILFEKENILAPKLEEETDIITTNSYTVYCLFSLAFLAIGLLFYMNYKVMNNMNNTGAKAGRSNSEANLIFNGESEHS